MNAGNLKFNKGRCIVVRFTCKKNNNIDQIIQTSIQTWHKQLKNNANIFHWSRQLMWCHFSYWSMWFIACFVSAQCTLFLTHSLLSFIQKKTCFRLNGRVKFSCQNALLSGKHFYDDELRFIETKLAYHATACTTQFFISFLVFRLNRRIIIIQFSKRYTEHTQTINAIICKEWITAKWELVLIKT
jgi:hypothetical protein